MSTLLVITAGPHTTVQDRGRPGLAALGVGASGAMDRAAFALGNRLVGNAPEAAGLEILLGGVRLTAESAAWITLTGATGPADIDGNPVEPHTATLLAAGAELQIGAAVHGIRRYLAVRGGIDVPPMLGSRSRDTLAGLGPDVIADGDRLPVGLAPVSPIPAIDLVPVDRPSDSVTLEITTGPRRDWFSTAAWARLTSARWTVSPRSDRTGIRLDGPTLDRARDGELPSEGMVPGAIQVSPDGSPTILGPDAPVTGGYPVIAVVSDASLDTLAQLRPGQTVRMRSRAG